MRFFSFLAMGCVFFLLCSCKTQSIVTDNYLQYSDTSVRTLLNLAEPHIQKNDLLSIKVYSQSADPRVDIPYNLPEPVTTGGASNPTQTGFLVDETGNIEYPRLGLVHAEGLTKAELGQEIRMKLDTLLKKPSVIVRFLNYRVTVLGEVKSPGTFTIPTERITILEALGLAGDVTEFGKRDTVKVAREIDGHLQIGTVSLRSSDFFSSPYYRLQQNDVVFVEQTKRRLQQQERQNVAQQVGIATGIITAIALIVNIIR